MIHSPDRVYDGAKPRSEYWSVVDSDEYFNELFQIFYDNTCISEAYVYAPAVLEDTYIKTPFSKIGAHVKTID